MENLIGRKAEIGILYDALHSNKAEMIAVIGRRRVGKTFLVHHVYKKEIIYAITGIEGAPLHEQLANFAYQLNTYASVAIPFKNPKNWLEAFQMLISFLREEVEKGEYKPVVFFDELPWLASPKSGFLRALSFFWNSWAVNQKIAVVICGSAASWMIKNVVNHKGGLHNRITKRIFLNPFTLMETELFFKSRNINFEKYHIIQIYMAMGGIPLYLEEIMPGLSATQNINQICFSQNGLLRDEFLKLYRSLFTNANKHITIIRTLSKKRQGMTRDEITTYKKVPTGGTLQRVLEELEHSGFISTYRPFGKKKKEKLFRLSDEYSLFYLQFIENNAYEGEDTWNHLSQTQSFKTWSGYAYENICLKHLSQIKKTLGITGIYASSSSFYKKGTSKEKGAQIDLVLDRNDAVINLFEIKFSHTLYSITKSYYENLNNKIAIFKEATKTTKQIQLIFITTFGLNQNKYSTGLVAKSFTMNDLFE